MSSYYEQFNQNCSDVENYSTNLTVQQAAALWCGVTADKVSRILRESKPLRETSEHGKSILVHPHIHCLKPRCEAIQEAIENDELRVGRDGGKPFLFSESGQVAYSRRTINREEFKLWIKQKFPNYLPNSLFSDIEANTHQAITKDAYLALKADRDRLVIELAKANSISTELRNKNDDLTSENTHLKGLIDQLATPDNPNLDDKNLIVIAAMLEGMAKARRDKGISTAGIQNSLIQNMIEAYPNVKGISESSLQKKFAEANNKLKQAIE